MQPVRSFFRLCMVVVLLTQVASSAPDQSAEAAFTPAMVQAKFLAHRYSVIRLVQEFQSPRFFSGEERVFPLEKIWSALQEDIAELKSLANEIDAVVAEPAGTWGTEERYWLKLLRQEIDFTAQMRFDQPAVIAEPTKCPLRLAEVCPFPTDEFPEWVEIFNSSSEPFSLHGYFLADGMGLKVPLDKGGVLGGKARLLVTLGAGGQAGSAPAPAREGTGPDLWGTKHSLRETKKSLLSSRLVETVNAKGNLLRWKDGNTGFHFDSPWGRRSLGDSSAGLIALCWSSSDGNGRNVVVDKAIWQGKNMSAAEYVRHAMISAHWPSPRDSVPIDPERTAGSVLVLSTFPNPPNHLSSVNWEEISVADATPGVAPGWIGEAGDCLADSNWLKARIEEVPERQLPVRLAPSTEAAESFPGQHPDDSLVITEVCFRPNEGEPEWIEICNPSTAPVPSAGWALLDGQRLSLPLPTTIGSIPPKGCLLVVLDRDESRFSGFDDQGRGVLHAEAMIGTKNVLGDRGGHVYLGRPAVDVRQNGCSYVAWGTVPPLLGDILTTPSATPIGKNWYSGLVGDYLMVDGDIFPRRIYPGSAHAQHDGQWVCLFPEETTPGHAPFSREEWPIVALLPFEGTSYALGGHGVGLAWKPIACSPAPDGYEVELATDPLFDDVFTRRVVDATEIRTERLPPGTLVLFWRVRALWDDGVKGVWSSSYLESDAP